MYPIDLHVHSTMSDGTFTPREIAFYAKAKGLQTIALTDHDTISGVLECQEAGNLVNLKVIAGIEFSVNYFDKEVHMLGYFIDIHNEKLTSHLENLVVSRHERNLKMLEKLGELGFPMEYSDIATSEKNALLTRAHFAQAMLKKGYVKNIDDAFNLYLGNGKPAFIPREHVDFKECIDLIHEIGGVAVIAHPGLYKSFTDEKLDKFIKTLAEAGLDGIETIYPKYSKEQEEEFLYLCKKYNLLPTGGSDFHGENKKDLDIGKGYGKTFVPSTLLDALETLL
ncbi:MAG: hypothetical protein ATN36_02820 [Epulopiscium sp. Nele67-Bin005]|nr:MAG: hypothetical protein ATN36_02820 [Epulopiscium sp. Nele67-Bin005]